MLTVRIIEREHYIPGHYSWSTMEIPSLVQSTVDVTLHAPAIPVINNVDVASPVDAAAIRDALVRQAAGAVRWVEVVQSLKARGMTHVVECGPGAALAGMVKRIDGELVTGGINDPASLAAMKGVLA